ncbi:phosphoribosylanthranilate isomerase [Campylobacter sp. faydin G-140]|uniref:phosphoribosylanthranilate isomerase n=1 Tax=Campylobacter anatolicus TaxID=2829105 RepID=UPI001B8FB9A1|nr:phosphoribosylanthranilate isomerase [Campylobacter anatolicus]
MKPFIKICGIKSVDEAILVALLDVDYLGVIFTKSKRRVSPQIGSDISDVAHKYGKKCVGVFAQQSECEVLDICEAVGLDVVQIYNDVSENLMANLHQMGIELWRVYSVSDVLPDVSGGRFDMIMFDCKGEKVGGNGVKFDWEILKDIKFNFALAGGIGADNVLEAIKFKPYVIDVNSKVENENGIKVPEKIENIIRMIK